MSDIEDEPPPVLLPCTVCSRTFRPEVLERHVKVCEKTASKKRRVFDSFKNRVSGTELEEFLGPAPLPGQAPKRPVKSPVKKSNPSKWKETHENLIAVLRAARGVESSSDTMLEAPRPAGNEQCPSCNRFFGPRAFDRHVEFCKEKTARIKLTPSKVSQAQERLEARTKYRAPLSIKPKLTTKEKYSPMLPRKESTESCTTTKTSPPIPTLNRNSKPGKPSSSSFSRQSPVRQSERQRSVSPTKKSVVSNSKSSVKNEAQTRTLNHPKIKENLRSPEDLRSKTGIKLTAQEKIRSCNVKLSPSEDDRQTVVSVSKKPREKIVPKSNVPSDNESVGTVESETAEEKPGKSRWTSSETGRRQTRKTPARPEREPEKTVPETGTPRKGGKRNGGKQKPLINGVTVNDESFGIFVAPCSVRQASASSSRTSLKTRKESPKKPAVGKVSKIPKAKPEMVKNNREKPEVPDKIELDPEPEPEPEPIRPVADNERRVEGEEVPEETVKRKPMKRWRNIADVPTEELAAMSEDFALPEEEPPQELSESAIWEIAGEQFLRSEDSVQSTSVLSVDSLENGEKRQAGTQAAVSGGDDFIVLHVSDPAKLVEYDADMKLSMSEPSFPCSNRGHKRKERLSDNKKIDIVVFTAFPNAIQQKLCHRRRKWRRPKRPRASPRLLETREKTFLATELPKLKRRRLGARPARPTVDVTEFSFEAPSKEEVEKRKKKFIEGLKTQKEKIRKWHITANSHIRFMEEFHKSLEDDLKELKGLFGGKKLRRRPHMKELTKQKAPAAEKRPGTDGRGKKFEFFVINLEDEEKQEPPRKPEAPKSPGKTMRDKADEEPMEKTNPKPVQTEPVTAATVSSHPNSSLENIKEEDEEEEEEARKEEEKKEKGKAKGIEIEDFIVARPDAQKILSKDGPFLEELFPKTRKTEAAVTRGESATAVQLGFSADTVFDLRSNGEKVPGRTAPKRMLERRTCRKESNLPRIPVKRHGERKENSMISLIELWKSKSGKSDSEKMYKTKATLPTGKLAPLTDKNSFQIAVLPTVLKRKLAEMIEDGLRQEDSYDPFKQAERQMLALLSWPSTVDIKTAKDLSPKPKSNSQQKSTNLETSPTSAFTKYPNKEGTKPGKKLNETFELGETARKNARNEKPTYAAADDWEEIFEKHFDLNRNEMTDPMTRSTKSALDGFPRDPGEDSIITEVLYTSTPKQKSERNSKSRTIDLDETPNTYRKSSNRAHGRGTPPEDFSDTLGRGRKEEKANRNSGISLSSLSFCSQISDTTLADEEVMRSNLEIIGKAAAAAAARTPRRKYARSQSVFDERNKMLFAKTYDPNVSSSDENDAGAVVAAAPTTTKPQEKPGKKSPSRNPLHPKSVPSHFYRSHSVMEDRCKGDGDHSDEGDHVSSPESNRNRKAKLSGDSAYSSLNRRSPRQNAQPNQQEDRLSSSGSDHSLPTINNEYDLKPTSLDFGGSTTTTTKKDQPVKMSKFCHECGSKYPVAVAKFCCECGVRRLVI